MSVNDESEHPWLREEKALVREAVGAGRPFLGVCLGVQLLASALGASVRPNPAGAEVGLLPVARTRAGVARPGPRRARRADRDPAVARRHLRPPGRDRAARELAGGPQPGLRVGRAYGVQFHLEVTGEMAREWGEVPEYRASLASTLGEAGGAAFLDEVQRRADEMAVQRRTLFEGWLRSAGVPVAR